MAGERELAEAVQDLMVTVERLTDQLRQTSIDLVSHKQSLDGLAAETNTLSEIIETEQQRRASP